MTDDKALRAAQVLSTLHDLMQASESDTARIQAAKILLERLSPSEDEDAERRQAEERATALDAARGLLAEFAALKLASLRPAGELAEAGAPGTTDAAG